MTMDLPTAPHRRMSVQLIILILVCTLIPLGVVGYVSVTEAQSGLEEQTEESLNAEIQSVIAATEARSESYTQLVRLAEAHQSTDALYEHSTERDDLNVGEPRDYQSRLEDSPEYQNSVEYLRMLESQEPQVQAIRLFAEDGNTLVSIRDGEEVDEYWGDQDWFIHGMSDLVAEDEVWVSEMSISPDTGEPALRYLTPVEVDGERVGIVMIAFDIDHIVEPVRALEIGERGYGMMIDPIYTTPHEREMLGAMYVAHGDDPTLEYNEDIAGDIIVDGDRLEGQSGTITVNQFGEDWTLMYEQMDLATEKDYYMTAAVPRNQMLAASFAIRNQTALIGGIAGIIAIAVGLVATRRQARPIKRLTDEAEAIAGGDLDQSISQAGVNEEFERLTESVGKMKNNVVEALETAEKREVEANEAKEQAERAKEEAEQSRAEAEEAKAEAEALSSSLQAKANEYQSVMERAANGDFTVRMDPESESEAMTAIAETFNDMIVDLEETVQQIRTLAQDVNEASVEVSASSDELEEASNEVATSAETISAATDEQTDRFREALSELNNLSATIEEIAATTDDVATRSGELTDRAQEGGEAANEAITEIEELESQADSVVEYIEDLDAELDEIEDIVDVIDNIAEQTNMLALNASVEAANAEAGGDGFAVVAQEVKSLAGETAEATQDVATLIDEVQTSADETVEEIQTMRDRVDDAVHTVEDSLEALEEIAEGVSETNESIHSIDTATDEQAETSQEVVSMIDEATDDSEETNQEAASVAAAAEEQTATSTEVAKAAAMLEDRATKLEDQLSAFTVGSADDEQAIDTVDEE